LILFIETTASDQQINFSLEIEITVGV